MRVKYFLVLVFMACLCIVHAQERRENLFKKNACYFEAFGNAGFYSINYERVIASELKYKITTRLGFSVYPEIFGNGWNSLVLPLEADILFGKKNKFFEIGAGIDFGFSDNIKDRFGIFGLARLGYRSISAKNFLFRVGITPIYWVEKIYSDYYTREKEFRIYPWAGISFGKAF